jgi:ParB family chromosome partitioning protein
VSLERIQLAPADKFVFKLQVRGSINPKGDPDLAQSIEDNGILQPPRVQLVDDRYVPVCGERRIRAAILAGMKAIPVIVEEKPLTLGEVLQRQLIENMQRVDLTPMEKARGIRGLMEETSWSATETARKLGHSNATVSQLLALLELPPSIQDAVHSGKISRSAAYKLSQIRDAQKQADFAKRLSEGQLTRDDLDTAMKPRRRQRPQSNRPARLTARLGGGRSVAISGPGLTGETLIAWLEELLSRVREIAVQATDLPSLAKLLKVSEVTR